MNPHPRVATLFLPLRSPGLAWLGVLLATVLHTLTMARDLGFYDSAELAVAAVQLGLSHPPGQPLYTLLGHLFAHLPGVAPLFGLNLLSAIAGGLTLLPALSLAERMAGEHRTPSWPMLMALLLGSQHAALWEQATRIEVYALAALLCMWCAARGAHLLAVPGARLRAWLGLGLGLGAAASVNPVLAAFVGCAALPGLVAALRARSVSVHAVLAAASGVLLGLLPYAYVPLVAGRTDALVWGAPTDGDALLAYLTGHDYSANLSVSAGLWATQAVQWLGFAIDFVLLPVWGLGLTASVLYPPSGLTRAFVPLLCTFSVAYLARYVSFLPEIPDYVSYVSLASWSCAAGVAALVTRFWDRARRLAAAALIAVLLVSAGLAYPAPQERTRRHDVTARAMASALLDSAPARAIVLVGPDHWVAPLWYLQEIEQRRPDVVVLASGLLSSSWYFEHLFRRHPQLTPAALRGPGGQLGRLARLLAANPDRPVLFEQPGDAQALGLPICVHRFFAAARFMCSSAPEERLAAAQLWARLYRTVGAGEPTTRGVLAEVSYRRGLMLAAAGDLPAALHTLLAPSDETLRTVPTGAPANLVLPAWQRAVPLGDPGRNLFVAAQLTLNAGLTQEGLTLMLAAQRLGLPEAERWVAAVGRSNATKPR